MKIKDEKSIRQEAIRLFLAEGKPSAICLSLGRSRRWFYKWLRRYRNGNDKWFEDESHRPKSHPFQTPPELEQTVIDIRRNLSDDNYSQTGAFTIQYEMKRLGLNPLPISTINRILKRNGLIIKRNKYEPSGIAYPKTGDDFANSVHQLDVVGPRYIKGDGRFYSFNLIDRCSHQISLFPSRTQEDKAAVQALIKAWKMIGIPEFLQMDNALYFRGSNRYPRSFGQVIRFCLSLGVQPAFIPLGEPWRQGILERFNNVYDKTFFRRQKFISFIHLQQASQEFADFHNQYHRYSVLQGKTPNQAFKELSLWESLLKDDYRLPPERIPLETGLIHLIRFIRNDKVLNIFGERFQLNNVPAYEYVIATICIDSHEIQVELDGKRVEEIYYPMPVDW